MTFLLLGPRGTGKSTWLGDTLAGAKFINLLEADKFFIEPSGKEITIPLDGPSYPMLVGEASYYEKNVAFYLMTKRKLHLANHPN